MRTAGVLSILFVVVLLAVAVIAQAQQPKTVPRIGYLGANDPVSESTRAEAIRLALRERGYIEGQSIAIEYRYAEGKRDRLPELAAELVRLKVDMIVVAGGDGPIRAAKNATKTIPIVMTGSGSPGVFTCCLLMLLEFFQALNGSGSAFTTCQDRKRYFSTVRTI